MANESERAGPERNDAERNFLQRGLEKLRRSVAILIFAAGITAGAGAMLYAKSDDLQQQQQQQTEQIQQLELRVQKLELQAPDQPLPAFCRCQKLGDNGVLLQRFCPAKNEVCDEESAQICQAQLPGYQC